MKYVAPALALALPAVTAFPAIMAEIARKTEPDSILPRQFPGATPPFDASTQYVSNQGKYRFVAPSASDARGPCPGLNAMANHGYFPHNGVGSMQDFINGCQEAFGMGVDLGGFLAVYGAVFDGNLESYSIGGPVAGLVNGGGLLGEPMGLAGSHNKYEGDVSPIRGDLYVYKNDYLNQVSQFRELYQMAQENGDSVDLPLLTRYRVQRFEESISGNPYFFNAPFSGVIASPAAWTFIYRFMANKSEEHPEGLLNGAILKDFYSMTGDYPNFQYTPGHEKFPDNWYKRNPVDDYTIPYFAADAIAMIVEHPQFASLGGNTGKPNSFVGIEPADLTDGVFNSANLLKGNNAMCYGLEVAGQQAPDILTGLFTDIDPAMDLLGSQLTKVTNALGCPKLNNINKKQFNRYPGYTKLKSDGSY